MPFRRRYSRFRRAIGSGLSNGAGYRSCSTIPQPSKPTSCAARLSPGRSTLPWPRSTKAPSDTARAIGEAAVQDHDVMCPERLEQVANRLSARLHFVPAVGGIERTPERAAGNSKRALPQLVSQALGIGRQIAKRSELDGVVVGLG